MKIRPATPADAAAISALMHSLSHRFLASPTGPDSDAYFAATSPARMAEHIEEASRLFVVAHGPDGLAGFISLKNGTHISQFFVEPRHQGQGLGRRLWHEAQRRAGISEGTEVTVDSSRGAVAVYEHFGFAATGPAKQEAGVVFVPMCGMAAMDWPRNTRAHHEIAPRHFRPRHPRRNASFHRHAGVRSHHLRAPRSRRLAQRVSRRLSVCESRPCDSSFGRRKDCPGA
jgi:GNAT superfamily N-acetyltransferase